MQGASLTSRARRSGVAILALAALAAGTVSACLPASAPAAPLGEVHELPLPSGVTAAAIAAGPEGDMWFTEPESLAIGRITPGGTITEFKGLKGAPDGIALGPEGNMWFAELGPHMAIGRITPGGEISEFSEGLNQHPFDIARGPEGNMWFTTPHSIGRVTPSGQITEFSKGLSGNPGAIAAGADGNLWFTVEAAEPAIDRITPAGMITEFPIEHTWIKPIAIAQAADGAVAFTASGENPGEEFEYLIGLIKPSGAMYFTGLDAVPAGIATGPEGDLWFAGEGDEPGKSSAIGRVAGGVKPEELPDQHAHDFTSGLAEELEPESIAPGPEGSMWFTNNGHSPAIRWIGTGAPSAVREAPVISGAGEVGATLTCENPVWNEWASQQPSVSAFAFDGYSWALDGSPIAGASSNVYVPTTADASQQLSCTVTASYPLMSVTVSSSSPSVKIIQVVNGESGHANQLPSALALPRQTDSVTSKGTLHLKLDCSGAPCSGTVKLTVRTKVSTGKGKHRKTKTQTVTIASAMFTSLAPGTDEVSLKLAGRGLGLLRAHDYKLVPDVSISYATTAASHASVTGAIRLKGTKPKPKRS
jgi:virginiamycin B lyase